MKVSSLFSKKARINIEKIDAFRQKCYNRLNDITRRGLIGEPVSLWQSGATPELLFAV